MASQSSHSYTWLPEQSQEGNDPHHLESGASTNMNHSDALHATRLLHVEERPFQRVSQRLLGKDSLLKHSPRQLPSPPPEGGESEPNPEDEAAKREKLREEILLDFAALESSILRIQLIESSNARERERYAAEKAKIMATAQAVKDNTHELRDQLAEAQRVLDLRKGYDELANTLIQSKKLKSRPETREDITKLEKEIEDLEQESADFEGIWVGRREAFDKVVAEGQSLIKVIKGIKDEPEPEKDETMEDGEDGPGTKGERSRMGTPRPDGSTPMPGESTPLPGGSTPVPGFGEQTPLPEGGASPERAVNKFLDVEGSGTGTSSQVGSPMIRPEEGQTDVEMDGEQTQLDESGQEGKVETQEGMEMETAEGSESESEQAATPAEDMDES